MENTAADTIGQLLAAACQRFRDRPALFHTDGGSEVVDAAGARDATAMLVTIGADRPPGARGSRMW